VIFELLLMKNRFPDILDAVDRTTGPTKLVTGPADREQYGPI